MSVSRSRRLLVFGAGLVCVAMVAAACGSSKAKTSGTSPSTANPVAALVPSQYKGTTLTVALDATYPPDEFMQNGKIVGFDVDLMNALAGVMGIKIHNVDATFNGIIAGILSGKYQIGNSSFTDNKSREKQVDFVTYYTSGEGYYVSANSTTVFNGLSSICGHTVAVESGTIEESDAKAQSKKCTVHVLSFPDQNGANLAVSSGRAQVGFLDSQVASYVVSISHGQFKLVGTPFGTGPYGFAIAKNSGLAQPLLAAVKALMANGTYAQILRKWGALPGAISTPVINGAIS
jgi:polar amino acid transport system substrate-binding protein